MGLFDLLFNRNKKIYAADDGDEFCPRCDANLTLQKGFHNDVSYWTCKGCGQLLLGPEFEGEIVWNCDECGAFLNAQEGFADERGEWKCCECGYVNPINENAIFESNEEAERAVNSPYFNMAEDEVLSIMAYEELGSLNDREDIIVVRDEDGQLFVKKILDTFDESVFRYLQEHPVEHMPRIVSVHRSAKHLTVIEELIDGSTLYELLQEGTINDKTAIRIARDICLILKKLHGLEPPIIHRDIKPSNVMLDGDLNVYLLDVNVAKWYNPDEIEDTHLLGTQYYAAPEQSGYGFTASTEKTDIYGLGVLLNVMVTGKLPKEEKASHDIWNIVERCICLEAKDRYSDDELLDALNNYMR